ncbi:hypothetical protein [Thalassococcus profundi]
MSLILIILAVHATALLAVQAFGLTLAREGGDRVAVRVPAAPPTRPRPL